MAKRPKPKPRRRKAVAQSNSRYGRPFPVRLSHSRKTDLLDQSVDNYELNDFVCAVNEAIEAGQPERLVSAFNWLRRSDPMLEGIITTRLAAINGLPWEITPAKVGDDANESAAAAASEAADYCREQLSSIGSFDDFLDHNLDAIVYGPSATEINWRPVGSSGHTIASFVPVPHTALFADSTCSAALKMNTSDFALRGVKLEDYANKFIVHVPSPIGPSPWSGGLAACSSIPCMCKKQAFRWLLTYTELFGMPFRKAKYKTGTPPEEINKLQVMLENMGASGWAITPDMVELDLVDPFKGTESLPQPKVISLIDKWLSIRILGQELTTATPDSGTGSYALGQVHEQVRQDILASDAAKEAKTIRRQLLSPMVNLSGIFTGAPIPHFNRRLPDTKDVFRRSQILNVALNSLGMEITTGYAHRELDIPMPDDVDPDELLVGRPQSSPFGGGFDFGNLPLDTPPTAASIRKAKGYV